MKMSVVIGGQSGADQSEDDGGTMPVTSSGAGVGDDGAEGGASRGLQASPGTSELKLPVQIIFN